MGSDITGMIWLNYKQRLFAFPLHNTRQRKPKKETMEPSSKTRFQSSIMKNSKPEIRVGARGWNFEQWNKEYFPDDLPEDWRFSFYSNDFQAVLVPADYLNQFSLDDWQEWIEDTDKGFWFYVEISESASWDDVEPYLKIFGDKLKGIVVAIEKLTSMDLLATLINRAKQLSTVSIRCIDKDVSDEDMMTLQSCYEINDCWNGRSDAPNWSYNESAAIIIRDITDDNNPESIRKIVEQGMEYAGGRESIALFFAGESPKVSDMQNARTIIELLA